MTIALIGRRGSRWTEAVAARCRRETVRLELEAAFDGALTIDGEHVEWSGFDATSAEAALVERAVFSWPQPGLGAMGRSPQAEREARALLVSALNALALRVRVLDPPESAQLAVAPLAALDLCARAGLAVHPWTLVAHRPEGGERIWLDPAGSDLELEAAPRAPRAGAPAWSPEPEGDGARFEGAVLSLLTIGGELVAARRYAAPESWAASESDALLAPSAIEPQSAELARAAERALGLAWLQTDLFAPTAGARILRVLPGIDLCDWECDSDGRASAAMAAILEDRTQASTR